MWSTSLPGDLAAQVPPLDPDTSRVRGFLAPHFRMAPGSVAVLAGPPGVGKTTLALALFASPAVQTSEMAPDQLARYAQRIGVELHSVGQIREGLDLEGLPVVQFDGLDPPELEGAPDLVIDSASGCARPLVVLEAARRYAHRFGTRALLIAHYTKDGTIKGSTELPHLADHDLRMERDGAGALRLEVKKTRDGPTWSGPFELDEAGVTAPERAGYFSVEGPPYRLRRHPAPGAKFAELLRYAEREEPLRERLPAPPVAVSAMRSSLYPGGWVEPEDLAQRIAAARAEGVPHWSPLTRSPGGDPRGQ